MFNTPLPNLFLLAAVALVSCSQDMDDGPLPPVEEPVVESFEVHVAGAIDEILIEDLEPAVRPPAPKQVAPSTSPTTKNTTPTSTPKLAKKTRAIGPRRPQLARNTLQSDERSQADIRNTIRTSLPQVRACYERELKARPSLEGKVVAQWSIAPSGHVQSPRVRSNSTASSSLASCITRVLKGWRFSSASHASDVEYPFTFRPRETW